MSKRNIKQGGSDVSREVMLRNRENGQWVKRSDEEVGLSENAIPSTLIQINHNKIYYTDTKLIINNIIDGRYKEKLYNLETEYNSIMDSLDNYRAYSFGIEKIFDNCETKASLFDNEIRRITVDFDKSCKNKECSKELIELSKAYLKVIFIYLYSAVSIHKEKVKNDSVINGKIISFKQYIQDLLEKVLIPSGWQDKLIYKESIYPMFIFSDQFNIEYISELVKYDRRFETPLSLIKEINIQNFKDSSLNYSEFTLNGSFKKFDIKCNAVEFIGSLLGILRDIDRLKSIRDEIGIIDNNYVFSQLELHLQNG